MGPVSMKEARERLSDLVRAAERGETTVITRRGKTVARIAPVEKKPRKRLPDLTEFRKSIKMRGKPMSQVVMDMRREARY